MKSTYAGRHASNMYGDLDKDKIKGTPDMHIQPPYIISFSHWNEEWDPQQINFTYIYTKFAIEKEEGKSGLERGRNKSRDIDAQAKRSRRTRRKLRQFKNDSRGALTLQRARTNLNSSEEY